MRAWVCFALLSACRAEKTVPLDTGGTGPIDADGDGWDAGLDCDDGDAGVSPGEPERCDGLDQDCDGDVDEDAGDAATWYADEDGDAHGDARYTTTACAAPDGWAALGDDCDDGDPGVFPGATEVCDGADDDCDGEVDEDAVDAAVWYADADGDGWGDAQTPATRCDAAEGWVADATDCDDTAADVSPAGVEVCDGLDDDCDGEVDEDAIDALVWYTDADGDGFGDPATAAWACEGAVSDGADCDDADADVSPAGVEVCDGLDDDCDGAVDEDAVDALAWYTDADGDGYGDPATLAWACEAAAGAVADGTDCDDTDATENPAAAWYADRDGDAHGDAASAVLGCDPGAGWTRADDDCDDADATAFPGGVEVCDGADDDCDGAVDEDAADTITTWADADGDGFGDPATATPACATSAGWVADDTDCDDTSGTVSPEGVEVCDGLDDDCDGAVDEDATDAVAWYTDADGDGYGDPATEGWACAAGAGEVADDTDCDDTDAAVHPGVTWYIDYDRDGYGDTAYTTVACDPGAGWAASADDCDDLDATAFPGGVEVCDGDDDDCDGSVDEDATDPLTFYADTDGDGYGDASVSAAACEASTGWVADATDCDDTSAAVSPAGVETCDDLDDDCDGLVDEDATDAPTWYDDADGDGYGDDATAVRDCDAPSGTLSTGGDCDDTDAEVSPGAAEVCDDVDDDCDGLVDDDDPDLGAGTCEPVLVASATGGPYGLALDDTYVYWVQNQDGDVYRAALDGTGSPELLANGSIWGESIAVDDTYVYWTTWGGCTLSRAPIGGGSATTLVSGCRPRSIAMVGTTLYTTVSGSGTIVSVPRTGGATTTLVSGEVGAEMVATDGTYLYWSSPTTATIRRSTLTGASRTEIASGLDQPITVAVDDLYVYWKDQDLGLVQRAPVGGGDVVTLASGQAFGAGSGPYNTGLVVRDGTVYWTDPWNGDVNAVSRDGGDVVTLASGQTRPWAIAVDDTYVYWSEFDDEDIWKIAR